MKNSIFEYQDYKRYLAALIASKPKRGRGIRSQLAEAAGCQVTYISQVLNGTHHLSLEQAVRVNAFFVHSKEEAHFFILLVQLARSGDRATRAYFQEQLETELTKRLVLTRRLGMAEGITAEAQVTYYSAWYYAAIHVLVSIPEFQFKVALSEKLSLPKEVISEVVEFLCQVGLVKQLGDRFVPGPSLIHLDQKSKLTARSHANWRMRVLHALDSPKQTDVHYTGVVSLSAADAMKIKALVLKQIEEVLDVVKPSKEEQLAVLCVDFFSP